MTSAVGPVPQLSIATLSQTSADLVPPYNRSEAPSVVHIGVGAFARAHLGSFADELSRRGHPLLIRGVSLLSPRASEQLTPQDCLYTLTERSPDGTKRRRVMGAFTSVRTGAAEAVRAIAAPETRLVSLTVTEKGYEASLQDATRPDLPASAPGVIALALIQRRAAGLPPPVVVSLDNLSDNGGILRRAVLDCLIRLEPAAAESVAEAVSFPSTVVDRLVPATTESDLTDVCRELELFDAAAVTTEAHRSWVMTRVEGLPPLEMVGVTLTNDVTPFAQRKLWLLNGPHSALAYAGLAAGCPTIAAASTDPRVGPFVSRLVDDVLEAIRLPGWVPTESFAKDVLLRFTNPALHHACTKVAEDGSRKLPLRFGPVVRARQRRGLDISRFAVVTALWILAASKQQVRGLELVEIEDPATPDLRVALERSNTRHLVHVALRDWTNELFEAATAQALEDLRHQGLGLLEALT